MADCFSFRKLLVFLPFKTLSTSINCISLLWHRHQYVFTIIHMMRVRKFSFTFESVLNYIGLGQHFPMVQFHVDTYNSKKIIQAYITSVVDAEGWARVIQTDCCRFLTAKNVVFFFSDLASIASYVTCHLFNFIATQSFFFTLKFQITSLQKCLILIL